MLVKLCAYQLSADKNQCNKLRRSIHTIGKEVFSNSWHSELYNLVDISVGPYTVIFIAVGSSFASLNDS